MEKGLSEKKLNKIISAILENNNKNNFVLYNSLNETINVYDLSNLISYFNHINETFVPIVKEMSNEDESLLNKISESWVYHVIPKINPIKMNDFEKAFKNESSENAEMNDIKKINFFKVYFKDELKKWLDENNLRPCLADPECFNKLGILINNILNKHKLLDYIKFGDIIEINSNQENMYLSFKVFEDTLKILIFKGKEGLSHLERIYKYIKTKQNTSFLDSISLYYEIIFKKSTFKKNKEASFNIDCAFHGDNFISEHYLNYGNFCEIYETLNLLDTYLNKTKLKKDSKNDLFHSLRYSSSKDVIYEWRIDKHIPEYLSYMVNNFLTLSEMERVINSHKEADFDIFVCDKIKDEDEPRDTNFIYGLRLVDSNLNVLIDMNSKNPPVYGLKGLLKFATISSLEINELPGIIYVKDDSILDIARQVFGEKIKIKIKDKLNYIENAKYIKKRSKKKEILN